MLGNAAIEDVGLAKFVARHLVILTCDYESLNSDGSVFHRGTAVFSGFVLELHGDWFWVTAGHCLKNELDKRIAAAQIRVVGGGFMDYFGLEAKHAFLIPYTYELGDGLYLEQLNIGMDFGLIHLDSLKKAAFAGNGVKPVSRENWIYQPSLSFESYTMLGIPKDQVYPPSDKGSVFGAGVRATMISIKRINPTDVENISSQDWFVGRIPETVTIPTVEGMSGGPIYGFRRNAKGQWTYHVVALQSRWRPESRIIFGCSLPLFAEAVHRIFRDCID